MEKSDSIVIYLGEWLFNAGVTGLINILGKENINFIDKQSIEIPMSLLENFQDKYFNYFINTYRKTLSWNKIVSYEEKIQYHLETEFKNFNESSLEELNKFIGSDGVSGTLKYYINSSSYKSTYNLIDTKTDILKLIKEIKIVKMSNKGEEIKDKLEQVKEEYRKITEVISFCKLENGRKYLAAKNVIYTIIKNSWNGVCFLNPQTKEKDVYIDYKNYFLLPVKEYKNTEKSKYKYNCFVCDEAVKDLNNDISFLNMTGFDTNRKTSHVWNFINDVGLCPVCKLVYSCVPAGITYVYDKGIFINDNSSIKNLVSINNKVKNEVLHERELNNSLTYKGLIDSINEEFNDKIKYELADIQIVRYENETYRFNILSKRTLEIIKSSKSDLNFLIKAGFKEGNSYFKIYELVVQRLFNNQNLYTLIHKTLLYKLSNPINSHYNSSHIIKLLKINLRFLEGIEVMDKNEKDIVKSGNTSGYYLKKEYEKKETKDKLRGISYRLLNALKTNNTDTFMDTLLNCYLYVKKPVPSIFLDVLRDDDAFKTIGYSFVAGLIDGKEESKDNIEGGN